MKGDEVLFPAKKAGTEAKERRLRRASVGMTTK